MDGNGRKLLKSRFVADSLIELLPVYGYNSVQDIAEINEEAIAEIESLVRAGNFHGVVDINCKEARLKFFGYGTIIHTEFVVNNRTRRKLIDALAEAIKIIQHEPK
jgi:hypothetical protein